MVTKSSAFAELQENFLAVSLLTGGRQNIRILLDENLQNRNEFGNIWQFAKWLSKATQI